MAERFILMIVPTLRVGMPDRTLCVPVTRSVRRCVTTQSVVTIKKREVDSFLTGIIP
jgi:hypothetical protein